MNEYYLAIIILLCASNIIFFTWALHYKVRLNSAEKNLKQKKEFLKKEDQVLLGKGLYEHNKKAQERKSHRKEKIIHYLMRHQTVQNNDVEKILNVSDATATRYLDELEEEKIICSRHKGRGTIYTLNCE